MDRKFIFLDFDGVLHIKCGKHFSKLKLFEEYLTKMPKAEIVISSTWRESYEFEELRNFFDMPFREKVIGVTPILERGFEIGGRQKEIELFLQKCCLAEKSSSWIALDDTESLFNPNCKNLILVNSNTGFREEDGYQLIKWYWKNELVTHLGTI
ncbi:conserved hypothetical protein [Gammaproteobacteria bacterium]